MKNKIWFWIAIIIAITVIAAIFVFVSIQRSNHQMPIVQEIDISKLSDDIRDEIEPEISSAGLHTFDDGKQTYILLTYGNAEGYQMHITPHINNQDVFFRVYASDNNKKSQEYVIYTVKNAASISANTSSLLNPEYMPGTSGVNIGWITTNNKGIENIVAILDPESNDTTFEFGGSVCIQSNGLYEYEYTVKSTGTCITSVKKLNEYACAMQLILLDEEEKTVTDAVSGLCMKFDENLRSQIENAVKSGKTMTVSINGNADGVLITKISEQITQSGGELA